MTEQRETPRQARSNEAREERRMMILASALRLIETERYDQATMLEVARCAGIAKGTLYLYFPTKETLFLELLGDRLGAWFDDVEREIANAGQDVVIDVPAILANSLAKRQAMCRLWGLMRPTLERNVDDEVVRQFKLDLARRLEHTAAMLSDHLPSLSSDQIRMVLMRMHAFMVGLVQMSSSSLELTAKAGFDDPRLDVFRVDYEAELRTALRDWIAGMRSSNLN